VDPGSRGPHVAPAVGDGIVDDAGPGECRALVVPREAH
jgi:hypothetical protein